MNQKYKIWLI